MEAVDVLVAGAGPVGLLAASQLSGVSGAPTPYSPTPRRAGSARRPSRSAAAPS